MEKEKKRNPKSNRERELGKFSMKRFDSATSSTLDLSVIISYRKKLKNAKF